MNEEEIILNILEGKIYRVLDRTKFPSAPKYVGEWMTFEEALNYRCEGQLQIWKNGQWHWANWNTKEPF